MQISLSTFNLYLSPLKIFAVYWSNISRYNISFPGLHLIFLDRSVKNPNNVTKDVLSVELCMSHFTKI